MSDLNTEPNIDGANNMSAHPATADLGNEWHPCFSYASAEEATAAVLLAQSSNTAFLRVQQTSLETCTAPNERGWCYAALGVAGRAAGVAATAGSALLMRPVVKYAAVWGLCAFGFYGTAFAVWYLV
jgi:hypothetical protein